MLEAILANAWLDSLAADTTTSLAANLNAQMSSSSAARLAYLRIYGCEWQPLGNGAEEHERPAATPEATTVNLRR